MGTSLLPARVGLTTVSWFAAAGLLVIFSGPDMSKNASYASIFGLMLACLYVRHSDKRPDEEPISCWFLMAGLVSLFGGMIYYGWLDTPYYPAARCCAVVAGILWLLVYLRYLKLRGDSLRRLTPAEMKEALIAGEEMSAALIAGESREPHVLT